MEDQEIITKFNGIFSTVLKKDNIALTPTTTAADVEGWDSLTHMMLIDNIEKQFAVKFKLMEVMKFNNVGDMVACVKKKLG